MKKNAAILSLMFLTAQAGAQTKHPLGHDLPANVPVANREATTTINGKHKRNIDIDYLSAKDGLVTVIFIKSLSPVQCTVPQSRGMDFRSYKGDDIQWMLRHSAHHGVPPGKMANIIEKSMKMWREKRAGEDFDPKFQDKQLEMIKKYCTQLGWKKEPEAPKGP